MSSQTGTTLPSGQSGDPGLQQAPVGDSGPDFGLLKKAFEQCVADNQPYVDQCRQNYHTRYALWPGQTSDGKKHNRGGNGQPDPVPWDGASDLRVFLTDEAIVGKVAMLCTAFRKANVVGVPVEGNDLKRAKTVSNFMRWLVQTQIPEVSREVELLGNYINEKGIGALGIFWEKTEQKTLTTVTLDDLVQQFPQLNMQELIFIDEAKENLLAIFEEIYGCTRAKAGKMLRELRSKQTTTVATVGKTKSFPVIRAFNLDEDLFISDSATDIETAPAVYRVQYFTAEQLRGYVNTAGWDKGWVEQAIKTCKGKYLNVGQQQYMQPVSRSFIYNQQPASDLIGVVYAYQRLSDEDGVPGLYCTIFNPGLPPDAEQPGYAKSGLLGYNHGEYPFILFRREYLSRKLHDSRGIPEPGKPWQDQIKAHDDSRIDAASMAILPPMGYPIGRPPGRWGAGARVPERRPNEYHYLDRPAFDPITEKSQEILQGSFDRYFGRSTREQDPFAQLKGQNEVDKFMEGFSKAFRQIWHLYQQFGSEQVFFRVIGVRQADPTEFHKGDQGEEFDFYLSWDTQSLDAERQEKKLEALARICATFDKYGQVDYSEVLQIAVEIIDPNWAERVVEPKDVGSQKVVNETHNMLAQVFAGVDRDIDLNAPPDLVMQTIQNYGQQPDVQQRYQQDPAFKERLDKIVKQTDMQKKQIANRRIGRYGA